MHPEYNTYGAARVKKHIMKLPFDELFATRDLLAYGKRDTVDKTLQRMVKKGWIMRVARGVFVKPTADGTKAKLPSLLQIAITKARAFGKELFIHGQNAAHRFQLNQSSQDPCIFIASGHSTSFWCRSLEFNDATIHFKSASPRKMKLADRLPGQIIRAFQHIGPRLFDLSTWSKVRQRLNQTEYDDLKNAIKWMPMWMSDVYWDALSEFERAKMKSLRQSFLNDTSHKNANYKIHSRRHRWT